MVTAYNYFVTYTCYQSQHCLEQWWTQPCQYVIPNMLYITVYTYFLDQEHISYRFIIMIEEVATHNKMMSSSCCGR